MIQSNNPNLKPIKMSTISQNQIESKSLHNCNEAKFRALGQQLRHISEQFKDQRQLYKGKYLNVNRIRRRLGVPEPATLILATFATAMLAGPSLWRQLLLTLVILS